MTAPGQFSRDVAIRIKVGPEGLRRGSIPRELPHNVRDRKPQGAKSHSLECLAVRRSVAVVTARGEVIWFKPDRKGPRRDIGGMP